MVRPTAKQMAQGVEILREQDRRRVASLVNGEKGKIELNILYRHTELTARAEAQALRLASSRSEFILREHVTMQQYATAKTLDEVEAAIVRREADQSPEVVRLRSLMVRR